MPEPLWLDRMALRSLTKVTTCAAIADAWDRVAPERLPRMLQGPWAGHTRLDLAFRLWFPVAGGSLIVEDTVVAQPSARRLGEAAWVWSQKDRKGLCGVSVVLLVWPDGQVRLPRACRVWHQGGASQDALALELRSEARNRLRCKPALVLVDAWYPSTKLRKRMRDDGWSCGCPLQQTRVLEGRA